MTEAIVLYVYVHRGEGERAVARLNYAPAKCHQPAVRLARAHFQRVSSLLVLRAAVRRMPAWRGGWDFGKG
jgi:hypothetical protein